MSRVLEAADRQFQVPVTHVGVKNCFPCGIIKGDAGSRVVAVSVLRGFDMVWRVHQLRTPGLHAFPHSFGYCCLFFAAGLILMPRYLGYCCLAWPEVTGDRAFGRHFPSEGMRLYMVPIGMG